MNAACPKCGQLQVAGAEQCERCGVIFSRVRSREQKYSLPQLTESAIGSSGGIVERLLLAKSGQQTVVIMVKSVFLLALAVWGGRLASQPIISNALGESFLHLLNLPFHEAGHVFFTPLGRFMQILGGTLMQLLVPAVMALEFLRRCDSYASSIGLWWLGESFLDISPYIDDARTGQLMLLGGVTGSEVEDYHDWEGILSRLGMMQYDHAIARCSFGCGVMLMLVAVCWGGLILWREYVLRERQSL